MQQSPSGKRSFWQYSLAIIRMLGVVGALCFYLSGYVLRLAFTANDNLLADRYRRKFTSASLRILGVKVSVEGTPPEGVFLYVSNHRSMLDPFIELNRINAHIVSKAEVAKYPLVGFGVRLTGVIFVERDVADSRVAAREGIRKALVSGESVLVYPEGTTSSLDGTLEFKKGAFFVAAEEGIPVVPVALAYGNKEDSWSQGSLFMFFLRKFGKRRTYAAISIGHPRSLASDDTESAVEAIEGWVEAEFRRLSSNLAMENV